MPAHTSALRVALASCVEVAGKDPDDLAVITALHRRGVAAVHAAWDDPVLDWSAFDLVVVRSTWDYPARHAAFLAWASRLPRVFNPYPMLRWNTDKRYLGGLAAAGLPVIPTRFLGASDPFEPPTTPFVIKPAVSCGAKDTARYEPGEHARARAHVRRLQAEGRTVMVQPYLEGIDTHGEVGICFLGGSFSHAIRRGALLERGAPASEDHPLPFTVARHPHTAAERSLAEQCLRHAPGGRSAVLYARVDLAPGPDGEPMILEAELTEPNLFLDFSHGGADRLADCIVGALS